MKQTLCSACRKNNITSLHVQQKSQIKRLLCGDHLVSTLPLDPQYLQNSIEKLQIAFNQITTTILSVIQNFKLNVFSSYRIFERACYQLVDNEISNDDKLINLNKLQFTMGTFQMKKLFSNPSFAFRGILNQISNVFNQYTKRLDQNSLINHKTINANQPNRIQTKPYMTSKKISKKQEPLLQRVET